MQTDNELIAEFMGYEFVNDAPKEFPNGYWCLRTEEESDWIVEKDMKWDESWDWLMQVVDKINTTMARLRTKGDNYSLQRLLHFVSYVKIEDVRKECILFIKWYKFLE